MVGDGWIGYYNPFEEWPEELQQEYTYNPAGAEALLDDAGYPRGPDGTRFKTSVIGRHGALWEEYSELAATYWSEIGVDVEIEVMDGAAWVARVAEEDKTYGLSFHIAAMPYHPTHSISYRVSDESMSGNAQYNAWGLKDPAYDAMYLAAVAATTVKEQQRVILEADMYGLERHLNIWGPLEPQFMASQPWVIGFNGEVTLGNMLQGLIWSRLWIDSELKAAKGH